jgi:hypothetical protein
VRRSLFFGAVLCLLPFAATTAGQQTNVRIGDLRWLAGCWEQRDEAKGRFGWEQWMRPAGQTMIGMSRSVNNGKTVGFEFMRIVDDGSDIHYISKPSQNTEETAFKLVRFAAAEAVFENPAHDFPQRIIYRLDKADLFARIEGLNNGKPMGIDFHMTRGKCD